MGTCTIQQSDKELQGLRVKGLGFNILRFRSLVALDALVCVKG